MRGQWGEESTSRSKSQNLPALTLHTKKRRFTELKNSPDVAPFTRQLGLKRRSARHWGWAPSSTRH